MSDMANRWRMWAYYADDVKPPKRPGDLAISTWHTTEGSARIEVSAAGSRRDIGEVVLVAPFGEREESYSEP